MLLEYDYIFSPYISETAREELQELFFFNSNQSRYQTKILNAIEIYGKPIIISENELITIRLSTQNINQQTLFILDKEKESKLIGVLIYVKELTTINVVHLSFCEQNNFSKFCFIIKKFSQMLKNIKNIKFLKFQYNSIIITLEDINEFLK
ncbi:MAG: hypothetical protein ACOVSR_05370 [Bacteroidia bacterium]